MKINKITFNTNLNNTKSNKIAKANKNQQEYCTEPKYYQVMKNISFGSNNTPYYFFAENKAKDGSINGVKLSIPLKQSGGYLTFQMPKDILNNYILDDKKQIKRDNFDNFINLFNDEYSNMLSDQEKNIKNYKEELNQAKEYEKIIELLDESGELSFEEDETSEIFRIFREKVLENDDLETRALDFENTIRDEFTKRKHDLELTARLQNKDKQELAQLSLNRLLNIFALSKTQDGYNLDNFDKKRETVKKVELCELTLGFERRMPRIFSGLKNNDPDMVKGICNFIKNYEHSPIPVESMAQSLKYFVSKDPKQKEKIIEYMDKLGKFYPMENYDFSFDVIFENAFNQKTGEFDEKSAKLIPFIIDAIDRHLDEDWNTSFDVDMVEKYFKTIKNPINGEIFTFIHPEDFVMAELGCE